MAAWDPYLHAPVDYSEKFRDRVAELGQALSTELNAPVAHDADMNYRAGQQLVVYLDADGAPTADQNTAATMLKVAVSSRGPLWTFLAWRQDSPRHWSPLPVTQIPGTRAASTLATIADAVTRAGLQHVPESHLDDPVPGAETEMDGAPAVLHDVLFCEVC